jgi:integrase
MPPKSAHTVHILEGEATLYQRAGTPHWQLRYKAHGKWLRTTTKKEKLADAKKQAMEIIVRAKVLEGEGLPVVNKRFKTVANLAIKRMDDMNDSGQGKPTFKRYKQAINGYLIPFLGRHNIDKIDFAVLAKFQAWRKKEFGNREPSQSAINTHNSALNRVFDEALMRGFITKTQIPFLENKGLTSDRRPDFTEQEYTALYQYMRKWVKSAREGKEKRVRNMLRDYILILANTGLRPGTETMNLKWKHITFVEHDKKRYLTLTIKGKTQKHREIQVRHRVVRYLQRIQKRDEELSKLSFEDLIKKGIDEYVFRIEGKDSTTRYGKVFARLLEGAQLLEDKRTGKERTLYSLRHYYATQMLTKTDVTIYQLAEYMGTSVTMIEKHYGHLNLRNVANKFVGAGSVDSEVKARAQSR